MFKLNKKNTQTVDLSLSGIKKFIEYAKQFPVSSLSVGRAGRRITVYQNLVRPPESEQETAAADYSVKSSEKIKSDTVGIFVPVPEITTGAVVNKDQVVAHISAMKIESDILAPRDCIIQEVLVKANDQIEYGQPLFFIE